MLEIHALGGITLRQVDRPQAGLHSRKEQALLIYLAVTGTTHTRAHLTHLFWGDLAEPRAKANLRRALTHLRTLAAENLTITRQTVTFRRESGYTLDVEQFEQAVQRGISGWQAVVEADYPVSEPPAPIADLQTALEIYRGNFLEGFTLRGCPAFDEWVIGQREWLRQLAIEALRALIAFHQRRGEYPQAIDCAHRLLSLDLWLEETHRELMRLLALSGQRSAALAQYEQCRRLLSEELGLAPQPEDPQPYFERALSLVQAAAAGRLPHGQVLRIYGGYLVRQGETARGETYRRAAREIFRQLGATRELEKMRD